MTSSWTALYSRSTAESLLTVLCSDSCSLEEDSELRLLFTIVISGDLCSFFYSSKREDPVFARNSFTEVASECNGVLTSPIG